MIEYIPGLAGIPATESSISSIDGKNGILAYRGYSIKDLAKNASFEEVAMLLRD
ncbi:MAG: citrate synthase, partial [Candidatus Thioglobus sp.]|nr:citrate synthase [Candidatus Thioglobus sp.]